MKSPSSPTRRRANVALTPRRLLTLMAAAVLVTASVLGYFLSRSAGVSDRGYSVQDTAVYFAGEKIKTADPTTFRVLSAERALAADSRHVYSRNEIVVGIDRKSFEILDAEAFYMRDA